MYEFCSAALPWVALSVVVAVILAFRGKLKENRLARACVGFFGGIVLASVLNISLIYGMLFGLTAALFFSGGQKLAAKEIKE